MTDAEATPGNCVVCLSAAKFLLIFIFLYPQRIH